MIHKQTELTTNVLRKEDLDKMNLGCLIFLSEKCMGKILNNKWKLKTELI